MNSFFVIVLIFISAPLLNAQNPPCTFTDPSGNSYDFSPLQNVQTSASIQNGTYTFYVTPCANTPQNKLITPPCASSSTPAIQIENGQCTAYLASLSTQQFSYDNGTVVIAYTGGQDCGSGINRQAKIRFQCDLTTESNLWQVLSDFPSKCMYEFDWKTKYACPTGSSGLSGGAWFLIFVFAIILPVYLLGGFIYNIQVKKVAPGRDAIPNIEFWRDLPNLLKDGCKFTFGRCLGSPGYQTV